MLHGVRVRGDEHSQLIGGWEVKLMLASNGFENDPKLLDILTLALALTNRLVSFAKGVDLRKELLELLEHGATQCILENIHSTASLCTRVQVVDLSEFHISFILRQQSTDTMHNSALDMVGIYPILGTCKVLVDIGTHGCE